MQTSTKDQLNTIIADAYSCGIFYFEFVRETKKNFIAHVLRSCNGNQCRAAKELGMHRNTLSRTLAELKMEAREWNPRLQLREYRAAKAEKARTDGLEWFSAKDGEVVTKALRARA